MHTTLILELTSYCNLSCSMCILPKISRKRTFMSENLLIKILSDLRADGPHFNLLLPFRSGESSIHPQFKEMLRLIFQANHDHKIADGLGMDTNLQAWNEELIRSVLSSKQFVVLHFSIDASSMDTYRKVRCGGDFKKTVENALHFIRIKAQLGLRYPNLVFQFIVMEENQHEAMEFSSFWAEKLDEYGLSHQINCFYDQPSVIDQDTIFIRRCDAPCGDTALALRYEQIHQQAFEKITKTHSDRKRLLNTAEFRPDSSGNNVFTDSVKRSICSGPFTHLAVGADGKTTLCCQDVDSAVCIGNATDQSIFELWTGEKAQKLRKAHITGKLPPRCRECFNQVYPLISDSDFDKIIEKFGLNDLEN